MRMAERASWDEYFMMLAEVAAIRGNCLRRRVGAVIVRGNAITQDRVIRRQIRVYPDQTFDLVLVRKSIERLKATGLFQEALTTDGRPHPAPRRFRPATWRLPRP